MMKQTFSIQRRGSNQLAAVFFVMLLTIMIRYVPTSIANIFKYAYILLSLYILVQRNGKLYIKTTDGVLLGYISATCMATLISPFLSFSMALALLQFVLISISLITIKERNLKEIVTIFFSHFEILICAAVVYSAFLRFFGNVTYVNGMRINYIGLPYLGQRMMGMPGNYGFSSIFTNPNPFGFNIVTIIAWRLTRPREKKILTIAELVLLCYGLTLANSRAGYISAIIVFFCFLFFAVNKKWFRILISFILVGLVIIFVTLYFRQIIMFIQGVDLNGRENTWPLLIDSIKEHPILGTGYSSATKAILKGDATGTYNSYLSVLCDSGIVGFAFFVFYLVAGVIKAIVYRQHDKSGFPLFCILLSVAMLVVGFAENVFMNVTARFLLWMICLQALNIDSSGKTK